MPHKYILLLTTFLITAFGNIDAQNQFSKETNQKIWEAKDRNDVYYTLNVLKQGNKKDKLLALKGLLSWNDSSFHKSLMVLSERGNVKIRKAALEAIGQTRDSMFIDHLVSILKGKQKPGIQSAALVALGKCVTKSKVNVLLSVTNTTQFGYSECMYRAMLKGVGDKSLTANMVNLLNAKNYETRLYAAWYLSRSPFGVTSDNVGVVFEVLGKSRLDTRQEYSLTPMEEGFLVPLMMALGKAKVNGTDSMEIRNYFQSVLLSPLLKSEMNGLLSVSIYKAMEISKFQYDSSSVRWAYRGAQTIPAVQMSYADLISKDCKSFDKKSTLTYPPALVNLNKATSCHRDNLALPLTGTHFDVIWKVQGMENNYVNYPAINSILLQSDNSAVKSSAMESLIKCRNSKGFPEALIDNFNQTITILLKDADPGVVSILCNALLEKQIPIETNYEGLLKEVSKNLLLPRDMETFIDIEKVLAMIHSIPFKKPEPEWNNPLDWKHVKGIPTDQKVKVTTTKGEFIIKLNVNEAPGSVSAILKLVESGYYDGKFFHRMVPNFVVQGGCPRGDGFGSMNYTLRSEFSTLKYSTGAVGLASAGPDTESCQWFVTHCPALHLNGRYTIIGFVVSGMETIYNLGVGDIMIKVERL